MHSPSPAHAAGSAFILVVDDEYLARVTIVDELQDLGHAVIEAASGDEAAVMLERCRVDLVITDFRMPGRLDGAGLAGLIAENFPAVPVLMMSAERPDPAVLKGVDGFFPKPVRVERLCAEVAVLLAAAAQAPQDPPAHPSHTYV